MADLSRLKRAFFNAMKKAEPKQGAAVVPLVQGGGGAVFTDAPDIYQEEAIEQHYVTQLTPAILDTFESVGAPLYQFYACRLASGSQQPQMLRVVLNSSGKISDEATHYPIFKNSFLTGDFFQGVIPPQSLSSPATVSSYTGKAVLLEYASKFSGVNYTNITASDKARAVIFDGSMNAPALNSATTFEIYGVEHSIYCKEMAVNNAEYLKTQAQSASSNPLYNKLPYYNSYFYFVVDIHGRYTGGAAGWTLSSSEKNAAAAYYVSIEDYENEDAAEVFNNATNIFLNGSIVFPKDMSSGGLEQFVTVLANCGAANIGQTFAPYKPDASGLVCDAIVQNFYTIAGGGINLGGSVPNFTITVNKGLTDEYIFQPAITGNNLDYFHCIAEAIDAPEIVATYGGISDNYYYTITQTDAETEEVEQLDRAQVLYLNHCGRGYYLDYYKIWTDEDGIITINFYEGSTLKNQFEIVDNIPKRIL